MTKPPRSLQGRLLLMVMGLVAAVWLATAVATWLDVRHELDELLDSHLAQAAALLVVQQAQEVEGEDRRVDAPTLHRYASKVAFQVWHEGRLVLRSANAPSRPMAAAGKHFKAGFETVAIDAMSWRVFAAYGAERDVQVFVGEQVDSRTHIAWAVLRGMLWPMAVALPLLALAVWWSVRRGVAPLRALGRMLAARDPRVLEPVAMDRAPAEMAPMLDALNSLFVRIDALAESERRFTADAAHELRTPIAAIRAQAQVALGEADDALRRHALQATLEGCDRAIRLVEQLLTLSRLDAGDSPPQVPVDLCALVRRVLAEAAPRAARKRQNVVFDPAEPCRVPGDEALLAVLVRNLVDNAIGYSPANATIKVAVASEGGQVRLMVEDSGPGMAEKDLSRLGERFFRVLGSEHSGSGLGWSILRRVADAHRAQVRVGRSSSLGGLQVTVELPRLA
jgi:two-component system sensor histidine kinase QseC